ncbi:MAG: dihydrodipicolinate synthase family protein [Planctomycetota bacterium]|jgi:4-hydroxy-tetrahydrodipicolinate synthase
MAPDSQLPRPLRGIVPPMVTPLSDRDTLDGAGLERLVEHILAGGVQGLFILGTTGEGPSLSYRLRCQVIDRVCEQVAGRVPVLVGISDTSLVESLNLADYAADAGAAAVVLAPPYYYPAGQAELLQYVEQIAAELPLPVFLYNLPSHTKLSFEQDTLRRLIEIPNLLGLKDSSAEMIYFHKVRRLCERRADWSLLVGPEELLAEAVLLGAHGGVSGGANLCPRLYVELYQAAARGDTARVAELHAKVIEISQTIYRAADHGAAVIAGLKCALSCLGICNDLMAEPFRRPRDAERRLIEKHLAELDIPVETPRHARRG